MKKTVGIFGRRAAIMLILGTIAVLGLNYFVVGWPLFCSQPFPGTCDQGGCDVGEGWIATNCQIKCIYNYILTCTTPPPQ